MGPDGQVLRVRAYDRMARNEALLEREHWESTGVVEYRLQDGRLIEAFPDGSLHIHGTGVELQRTSRSAA